jgi:dTDP-4-amino-4,6-dideoxygalactose transaminase
MSNISAGIGRGQMEVLDKRVEARRNNHFFYVKLFEEIEGVTVFSEPNEDFYSNHWLSVITIDESITGWSNHDLRLQFEKEKIESRPLWKPMHLQPVFENCIYYGNSVAEDLFNKGLCLPSGSNLTEEQKNRIKEVVLKMK